MATIDLHYFKDDLAKKPTGNSGSPPRGVSAKDLDGNFWKVQVIEDPEATAAVYTVEYTEDGTVLKVLPKINETENYVLQTVDGQLQWTLVPKVNDTGTYVLGTVDGTLKWIATQDCSS